MTGFSVAPQPSTSLWGRQQSSTRAVMLSGLGPSAHRHRRRHPRGVASPRGWERAGGGEVPPAPAGKAAAAVGAGRGVGRLRLPSSGSTGRPSTPLAARPPTAEEMDAEWEGILAGDDDDDEDGDDEEEEEEDEDSILSAEELIAADAAEGGFLGGAGEEEEEEEEEKEPGWGRGAAGRGRGRKPRVWYDSYKARMKAEKAKAAAWQEKRKTFSQAHNDYLDEAQRNREIAAARYCVGTRPACCSRQC